ncbi:MAG: 5-(carboxyamino)imidazole ribonucleotide synthase [Bacteroidota bacterium]
MNGLKTKVGIIGGGQLGRMMIEEALRLNVNFAILENSSDCPCYNLADIFIEGSLYDENKIIELANNSDVLTFEIEHINTTALLKLEAAGKVIIPSPKVLQVIQDKGLQKQFYSNNNIPTSSYVLVNNVDEWPAAIKTLGTAKFVAKTRTDGYDGKGVTILTSEVILADLSKIPFNTPCVLEAFIPCQKEIAVIVAKDTHGNTVAYDAIEMEFDPTANLVTFLFSPAQISNTIADKAKQIAIETIEKFNSPGLFAVEMFLTDDNEILVNEIAPRAHNSGHHTIEACYTSQYEQLLRILIGLPVGSSNLLRPAAMINLLGDKDFSGNYKLDNLNEIHAIEGVYIHLYDKKESKPMRKMGHITLMADNIDLLKEKAKKVMDLIKFSAA